ncbi:MAG: homocysteine S-methyltransferase family protein [Candidatus Aegiribacteria sp.]|nr:homocysteine S-methyltransferase family protein [Candidatus Aegiribacteria sp.]
MNGFLERLRNGSILVADGAMGTMLFERGLKSGECPEAINLTRPSVLEEIARLYLDAGADIIQTNTFGGSPLKLASYSLEEKALLINRNAVLAVKRAVSGRAYVSGSCGPCGKILKPYGDTDPEDILESFEIQMQAFFESGCDIICIETMMDLSEMLLALRAAKERAPGIPVMATMTFDATPKGFFTIMGDTIEKAAHSLEEAGADVIGSNCGNGIEDMIRIAEEFRKRTTLPLIIQSNAGLPIIENGRLTYPESPEFMASMAKKLVDSGVSIIGGCCGTGPAHIRAIKNAISPAGPQ